MDSAPAATHWVLLGDPNHLALAEIGRVLAGERSIPLQDALRQVRTCHGFLARLTEAEARRLAGALEQAGIATLIQPDPLPQPPPPQMMARLELDDSALGLEARGGTRREIPWPQVRVLAGGAVKMSPQTKVRPGKGGVSGAQILSLGIMMTTGIPLRLGKKKKKKPPARQPRAKLEFFLDLIGGRPPLRARLEAAHLDYSCLGDRMGPGILANFRTLAQELVRRAPAALTGPATAAVLGREMPSRVASDGMRGFEREVQWLWALARSRSS